MAKDTNKTTTTRSTNSRNTAHVPSPSVTAKLPPTQPKSMKTDTQSGGGGNTAIKSSSSSSSSKRPHEEVEDEDEDDMDVHKELQIMLSDSNKEVARLKTEVKSKVRRLDKLEEQLEEARKQETVAQENRKEWETKVTELEKRCEEVTKKLEAAAAKPATSPSIIKRPHIPLIARIAGCGYATPLTRSLKPHTRIEVPDTNEQLPFLYHNQRMGNLKWTTPITIWNIYAHTFTNEYFRINPGALVEHGRVCQENLRAFIDYLAFRPSACYSRDVENSFLFLLCELCAAPLRYEHILQKHDVIINSSFDPKPFESVNASLTELAFWFAKCGFSYDKAAEMFRWCRLVIDNKVYQLKTATVIPTGELNWIRLEKDVRVPAVNHPATPEGQTYYYPPHPHASRQFSTGYSSPNEMDPPDSILEYCLTHNITSTNAISESSLVELSRMMEDEDEVPSQNKPSGTGPSTSTDHSSRPFIDRLGPKADGKLPVDVAINKLTFNRNVKGANADTNVEPMGPYIGV